MSKRSTKEILEQAVQANVFTVEHAKEFVLQNRIEVMAEYPQSVKRDVETLYLFSEGFVGEVLEGFVGEGNDHELLRLAKKILSKGDGITSEPSTSKVERVSPVIE